MRNKFKFLIFILSFIYVFINYSFSSEIFNFDVKEIEIIDNGNRFLGKKGGTAKTIDGITISAKNFDYEKIKNILIAIGDVQIYDPVNNVTIYTNKITYNKNDELIFTKGNSKAINEEIEIDAKNFKYNRLSNVIDANGDVKVNNKKENYLIFSDNITYNKNDELIFTKGNSKAINEEIEIDAKNFKYNRLSNVIDANGDVKVNNKKENYLIFSDNITYNKNDELIFTKGNSKAINEEIEIDAKNFKYNRLSNVIDANGDVKVNNKKENYLIFQIILLTIKMTN